jgi:hypothetical protein
MALNCVSLQDNSCVGSPRSLTKVQANRWIILQAKCFNYLVVTSNEYISAGIWQGLRLPHLIASYFFNKLCFYQAVDDGAILFSRVIGLDP